MNSRLLADHHAAFVGFVRSRTGDPELAEDIVQDSMLKALQTANAPADKEGVVTWFYRILRNAIIDTHRRRGVREKALESWHRICRRHRAKRAKKLCANAS
jgi:RNA polymerase sigma factor (sigma-70 family)